MREFTVQVKVRPVSYRLYIGSGLFPLLAASLKEDLPHDRIAIISDSTVAPLWADELKKALDEQGFSSRLLVVPAGEQSKSRAVKQQLEDQLLQEGFGRDSVVLALGGGVIGDLAGFTAATYMRGIPFIQIPTTTLAMADASIGGKTAVDTPYGKNLIGAFHQPLAVYLDMETLGTLGSRTFREGLAEVVKHGFIGSSALLAFLDRNLEAVLAGDKAVLEAMFEENCQVKNRVVSEDEEEQGLRQILNYGHTMGHAVELQEHFRLLHGECVTIGMAFAARLAVEKKLCPPEWAERQISLIRRLGLPVEIPKDLSAKALLDTMKHDKKSRGGRIRFVFSPAEGQAVYGIPVSEEEILTVLSKAGIH